MIPSKNGEHGIISTRTEYDRQISTVTAPFEELFIDDQSELGQTVTSLYESFAYFVNRDSQTEKEDDTISASYSDLDMPY